MRIAMIGQKRTGSREGGIEVVVAELATRMAALGHEVTCYDRGGTDVNGEPTPTEPYEYKGVRIVPVKTVDVRGLAALTSAYAATYAALKDRPDVIHYHAEGPCNALPLAARAGVRTVATIHGLDWQRAKWGGIASRVIRRGERKAAHVADALIVLSRSVQDYFRSEYGREAHLVPNGVSVARPAAANLITGRWGLTEGSYILYLGRIVPEKRPELLLEAFRGLDTGKRLVIAGGSSDTLGFYEQIRSLAERDARVIMAGFVEGRMLEELYSNAYCYVLPSDLEGMPMSLLEAMAHGCCCVTSDIPECVEVVGAAGVAFRRGDAISLRDELAALCSDPLRAASLGAEARIRVEDCCSWDSAVRQTIELYRGGAR
ncbi:glycosyltransferase family 4 protein [Collinsella ihumii]|uniref:Glycosyltransferase family 4 protein n=1 Tax=Collinsella ihumii TaxID=1720204 RepID=A0AAW7JMK1_9ACTN|nr:glycosyltransferase family 4 protein [Collinsella ihumii]MDN0068599.1 glycosyltransferase family 4 protein [Collinsella ihumii]